MKYFILMFLVVISLQSSVSQKMDSYTNERSEVEWNIERKLTWEDFKGTPPALSETNAAASTNCGFDVSAESNSSKKLIAVTIKNVFSCYKSWVRTDKKYRLDLLQHEQAHFDLCEVYARQLRKRVADSNYNLDMDNALYEVFDAFKQRQKLYDKETNHSRNKEKQKEWLKTIADELQELNAFKK
jgi:hypothetical protein